MNNWVKCFRRGLAAVLVLALCLGQALSADPTDPGFRSLPSDGPPSDKALSLAPPGYCNSNGGSHSYESIQSVSTVRTGQTMEITVNLWIANPTGCTSGSSCPEYDASPEYINVWIDWDGDQVWESHEKVMDAALTGYLGINYNGTMTAKVQVTIPPGAGGTIWLRANLGWSYDPNNPCESSWTWGDVLDQELQLEETAIKAKLVRVETVDNIPIVGVSNTIWERSITNHTDCDVGTNSVAVMPIAAPYSKGSFGIRTVVESCDSPESWEPMVVCTWEIQGTPFGRTTTTWGWDNRFDIQLPQQVGQEVLEIGVVVFDDDGNELDRITLDPRTLYVTYDDPKLEEPLENTWLDAATTWADGAQGEFGICTDLMDHIYDNDYAVDKKWSYDPGQLGFYDGVWKEFLAGTRKVGHCKFFAATWAKVAQLLGVGATYVWWQETGFITKTPAEALDGQTGKIYSGSTGQMDRWSFGMHSFGSYPVGPNNYYYDPTFGQPYDDMEQYIEWYLKSVFADPADPEKALRARFGRPKTGQSVEYADLYIETYGTFLKDHYYVSPPAAAPERPAPTLLATSISDGAAFTGNYEVIPIDSDGDGRYNRISVGIEVDVTSSEEHFLGGLLLFGDQLITRRGGFGQTVASVYDVDSSPGLDTVMVDFCGEDVFRRGFDGDYSFHFSISDADNNFVDAFAFTAPVDHTQFGEIPARITGIADQGIDLDADGLFDHLEVEIAISNHLAGDYSVLGSLAGGDVLIESEVATAHLEEGATSLVLLFSGQKVSRSGIDGPYVVSLSLEDKHYGVIDHATFETSPYTHTQFEASKAQPIDLYDDVPVDTDGNGLYDILRFQYDIQVGSAGTYFVSGWLEDSGDEAIGLCEVALTAVPGTHRVNLDFTGTSIYEHGQDGPYVLKFLMVRDGDGQLQDAVALDHHTIAYSYLSFERPAVPLIALTGAYSDYGQDSDGDGLYDYLTVDVEATCSDDGVAIASARLVAPDGEDIMWVSNHVMDVTAGVPFTIPLNFDGRYIFGSLQDGPYRVLDLLVYHTGDPNQAAFAQEANIDGVYAYEEFEAAAVICGTVWDYDTPVSGALLTSSGSDYDHTNHDGQYNLVQLQGGAYLVEMDPPVWLNAETWLVFVNDIPAGEGTSATVVANLGQVTRVDFRAAEHWVDIDIMPGFCPNMTPATISGGGGSSEEIVVEDAGANTLRDVGKSTPPAVNNKGNLVVAILGTQHFDVTDINPATVRLEGLAPTQVIPEPLAPFGSQQNLRDVATPVAAGAAESECNKAGPDGYDDLVLRFSKASLILTMGDINYDEAVKLTVKGELLDGTPFGGTDYVTFLQEKTTISDQSDISLDANYPNPFNPSTSIGFSLAVDGFVKLEIINVVGQKVATLIEREMEAGDHSVLWDGGDVASGVYFYRLELGDETAIRKMLLVK